MIETKPQRRTAPKGWAFLIVLALCCAPQIAHAADRCNATDRATADRQLWLNARDRAHAIETHLLWGLPEPADAQEQRILTQRNYVIGYDDELRIPIWTGNFVDAGRLGRVGRIDCFRKDPRIGQEEASYPADYDEPLFDQGHMVPNGDMSMTKNAVLNSFIMSNMTPQYCQFNRGVWQILETLVRHWAETQGDLYVINGAILDRDENEVRDADEDAERMESRSGRTQVAVATAFYKILVLPSDEGVETLSILLPHDQTDLDGQDAIDYLAAHIRSVGVIERQAGFRFQQTNADLRERRSLWPIEGAGFRSLVDNRCRATLITP